MKKYIIWCEETLKSPSVPILTLLSTLNIGEISLSTDTVLLGKYDKWNKNWNKAIAQ